MLVQFKEHGTGKDMMLARVLQSLPRIGEHVKILIPVKDRPEVALGMTPATHRYYAVMDVIHDAQEGRSDDYGPAPIEVFLKGPV